MFSRPNFKSTLRACFMWLLDNRDLTQPPQTHFPAEPATFQVCPPLSSKVHKVHLSKCLDSCSPKQMAAGFKLTEMKLKGGWGWGSDEVSEIALAEWTGHRLSSRSWGAENLCPHLTWRLQSQRDSASKQSIQPATPRANSDLGVPSLLSTLTLKHG